MSWREFAGDALIILSPIVILVGVVFAVAIIQGGDASPYGDDQ